MADRPSVYWKLFASWPGEPTRRRRGEMVCEELRRRGWSVSNDSADGCGIVVLQRCTTIAEVRRYLAQGHVTIFETNDVYLFRDSRFYNPEEATIVKLASAVVVTCRYMAQRYSRINPRTFIAQEALEPEFWTTPRPELAESPLVLSWHGMPDNLMYLESAVEALAGVPDLRLRIVMPERDSKGNSNRERVASWPVPADFAEWRLESFVHEIAQAHAGLVILPDTEFCRNKAHHKAVGYQALGIPVVASDMPGYREVVRNGETGFLAATPGELRDAVEALRDPKTRDAIGKRGRELSRHFTIESVGRVWDDILHGCWANRTEATR